jgi:glycosyltransferase involved in cell wall biosynthesis
MAPKIINSNNDLKVQVLLSTYNGEAYIKAQLDSILNQSYSNISILIRDDGSHDNTREILKEYKNNHAKIEYYEGDNIGVVNSFFNLINNADKNASFYALADQDDIWLKDKILIAINKINDINLDLPLLYCSDFTLVNKELQILKNQIPKIKVTPSFGNALVENKATGCTCVFNKKLINILQGKQPEYLIMHDWWIYLVANCFGNVLFDNESNILYRQHGNNAVGAANTILKETSKRIKRVGKNKGKIIKQINSFLKTYEITGYNKTLAEMVIHYKNNTRNKFRLLTTREIYRQRTIDNIILKLLFFFNMV